MNGSSRPRDLSISEFRSDAEVLSCFSLIQQLRPHLTRPEEWLERYRCQARAGYRVFASVEESSPSKKVLALAGVRFQENLVYGRFLYVDDLVTDAAERSGGLGTRLMRHLEQQARQAGCGRIVLDAAMSNALAHRFYYRCGLVAQAFRFNQAI